MPSPVSCDRPNHPQGLKCICALCPTVRCGLKAAECSRPARRINHRRQDANPDRSQVKLRYGPVNLTWAPNRPEKAYGFRDVDGGPCRLGRRGGLRLQYLRLFRRPKKQVAANRRHPGESRDLGRTTGVSTRFRIPLNPPKELHAAV